MRILLENIGRRFNREWIFKNLTYTFEQEQTYAVLGPNGSGKSTLLQVILGSLTPSEGKLVYINNKDNPISIESAFSLVSLAAPYLELIEEFTLTELINFHFRFKKIQTGFDNAEIIRLLGFEKSKDKSIKHFSSGMKQRTRLALAFCSDTPVLLLDEPTSNLDQKGVEWYYQLIEDLSAKRLLIICSNQEHEYRFCRHHLKLIDYK